MKNIRVKHWVVQEVRDNILITDNTLSDRINERKIADVEVLESSDIELVRIFHGGKEYIVNLK